MSLGALMMARSMATQYYGGNAFAFMDGKLASAMNVGATFDAKALKNVVNKENQYDYMIAEANLDGLVADKMYDNEKALQDRFAKSFDTFA